MQAKVRGGSPGGRSETKGVGFVKEVGFKLVAPLLKCYSVKMLGSIDRSTNCVLDFK